MRGPLPDLAAIGFIGACALILHRDGLGGGPAFYELDTLLFYFPLAQWVSQQLHAGVLPLWLPGIFTGYPIFADGELGLAYLPQLSLLWALPADVAMVWIRVLHVSLAGAFTYAFLRTLRLGRLPALGGGLVFAFGSFLSAQMHHENVVRSAVWLPAGLTCLERATCAEPRSRLRWTVLGAGAFAFAALGVHVQPVLMAALALGTFAVFRALTSGRSGLWPLVSGLAIIVGGLALSAVQWVPLGEWALASSRRAGVDYDFASAFALPPANLLSVVFPFFFRLADATTWWTLWQQWEIELYLGIPALGLIIVAIAFERRREVLYFLLLGVASLWIAMAEYAPIFNLHHLLWLLPGFSVLRAPARFSYLVVMAAACLVGFGLQALSTRRRTPVALVGGAPMAVLLIAILVTFPPTRGWLAADPSRAAVWAESNYLSARAQYPIDPALVVQGFVTSLDLGNLKTAWSVGLLLLTCLGFLAWWWRGARFGQALFVGLIAADLLVFAFDFHPRAPLSSLAPALNAPAAQRALMHDPSDLPAYEPDQLLAEDLPTTDGYSSLPPQRHVELATATSSDPRLFDLWSAPTILEPADPPDLQVVNGVRFRAEHPMVVGFGGSTAQVLDISSSSGAGQVRSLRLIGALSYAFNVPQGQTVATLTLGQTVIPIRAGIELSERAYDRPSVARLVQHQKARVAFDFEEVTPQGEAYTAHLYEADLTLPTTVSATSIVFEPLDPSVLVEVYGLGVVNPAEQMTSLDLANRQGLQRLTSELIHNANTLPRAFVLPLAQAFSPARHPALTVTQLVASPDVDLHRMVLIENDANTPVSPQGSATAVAATSVEDVGPDEVRVTATADGPSYLVLDDYYHRGWTASVDGQTTRIFVANALFRAVLVDTGQHVVDFRFQPLSLLVGGVISGLTLIAAIALLMWGSGGARPRRLR